MAPAKKKKKREFGGVKTSPKAPHPLWKQVLVGVVIVLAISLLITAIWYGTRVSSLQVTTVTIDGQETLKADELRALAEAQLEGTYFSLIPRTFAWLYPQSDIVAALEAVDKVKSVTVDREDQTVAVRIVEYVPDALWCRDKESDECFLMSATGFAFTESPGLQGGAFVRYIDPELTFQKQTQAFDAAYISRTKDFVRQLRTALDWYVTHIEKGERDDVSYWLASGGELKTVMTEPNEVTIENLQTVLTAEEFAEIAPGNFQYIDLRFGNKVYVNDTEPSVATSTVATTSAATSTVDF